MLQIIGKKQFRHNEDWFNQEYVDALNTKNAARWKLLQRYTRKTQQEYNEKSKENMHRQKKEAINRRLLDINEQHTGHNKVI